MGGRGASSASLSYQGKNGGSGKAYGEPLIKKLAEINHAVAEHPRITRNASETLDQLSKVENGQKTVRIYRAAPDSGINNADWVFLSLKQAAAWQKTPFGRLKRGTNGKPFNILSAVVPVSDINWTGKNLEFQYVGSRKRGVIQ